MQEDFTDALYGLPVETFGITSSKNIFHLKYIVFACTCTGFIFYGLIKVKT